MTELQKEQDKGIWALLVGAPKTSLLELSGLTHTLGMEIGKTIILPRITPTAKYGIGTGKAAEIAEIADAEECDCIIFDFEISPTQQRNWEVLAGIPVFDRHEVILRIFSQRAQTKEAFLQVELAQLQYSLPRLAHSYGDMARQKGGSYGSKGSGETQLELDKRAVTEKIAKIKKDLEKVVKERETQRKRREKIPIPTAALVGYTNAGKSSLLNALTNSGVFVEDKLFATLDPTTRKLTLHGGAGLLLTDTVGFISNLPHSLVDAFKSTLEETSRADLLLIILDGSDTEVFNHYKTVSKVLEEIDVDKTERLIVINKVDQPILLENNQQLLKDFPDAIWVSAKTKEGFNALSEKMTEMLFGEAKNYSLPLTRADLVQLVRKNGLLIKEQWENSSIEIRARAKGKTASVLKDFFNK